MDRIKKTYFKNDQPEIKGITRRPVFDCDPNAVILYCYEEPGGEALRVRHIAGLPPELLIELGYQIVALGKRLQQ